MRKSNKQEQNQIQNDLTEDVKSSTNQEQTEVLAASESNEVIENLVEEAAGTDFEQTVEVSETEPNVVETMETAPMQEHTPVDTLDEVLSEIKDEELKQEKKKKKKSKVKKAKKGKKTRKKRKLN